MKRSLFTSIPIHDAGAPAKHAKGREMEFPLWCVWRAWVFGVADGFLESSVSGRARGRMVLVCGAGVIESG